MAIGDESYEFLRFDDEPRQFLARITVVDPAGFRITADDTGALTVVPLQTLVEHVQEEEEPARVPAVGDKYRMEKEGDLWRIYALRDIRGRLVRAGDRGGLVSSPESLSQRGECWIAESSVVSGGSFVYNDAYVGASSVLEGYCRVWRNAKVTYSVLKGSVLLEGFSKVHKSTLSTEGTHGYIGLRDSCELEDTVIECPPGGGVDLGSAIIKAGHIRSQHEAISCGTRWGPLTAYRSKTGDLAFAVGCQTASSIAELHRIARSYRIKGHEAQMLEAFLAMAQVAQALWAPPSKSDQDASVVAAPVTPAVH